MVLLTGNSLGKRQHDLNKLVNDAAKREADFEKLKNEPSSTDIDVLFKIDLASKYKNVDYILEMLKSGDSLYISRALKCTWLYDEVYSKFINVDFLHHNIFPSMSFKMKRKFLTAISIYVRNEDRAESFYTYCLSMKLQNIALKFLVFSSESFKLDVIRKSFNIFVEQEEVFYNNFVGKSFTLARAIMQEASEFVKSKILFYLRYLISVSENDYLDLLEKYDSCDIVRDRFGLRISVNVLKKHKSRYLKYPLLYMGRLNKGLITKHITVEDAKNIAGQVLPATSEQFWHNRFCTKYEFVLKKIPPGEKFQFIKKIFNEKYPNEDFEMSKKFFNLGCYDLMTVDEREAWALRHIETNTEFHGVGRNYLWYEHVNFGKAFPEIKKYIFKMSNLTERFEVVEVLVKSVRSQKDMQTLLTYYYDRHVNEAKCYKVQFVKSIINCHNVFEFDNDCWTAFNKLLHSMKVYKTDDRCSSDLIIYTTVLYHIIHKIDLPETLKEYMLVFDMYWSSDIKELNDKISKDSKERVYQVVGKIYIDEVTKLKSVEQKDDDELLRYIMRYLNFLDAHKKTSGDCPDFITELVKTHEEYFQRCSLFQKKREVPLKEADLIRLLKNDSKFVVEKLPEVKNRISAFYYEKFKINTLLKKIKVYFPNDIAKDYLNYYTDALTDKDIKMTSSVCTIVYGIFQLADDQTKIDFTIKYAPTEPKINHAVIDERFLAIQEGICRTVCFSRPPLPLSNVLKYITGDYLRFCLPMFQSYQAKLPPSLLEEFVSSLIDAPVSIQKHALRLVFVCFSTDNMKKIVTDSWKRTKNVSLRFILYQSVFNKICYEDDKTQTELFEVLQKMTTELNEDDQIEIFESFMRNNKLPQNLLGSYIGICWETVSKFPDKTENFQIKRLVINNIADSINLLEPNFVKEIVDQHVNYMLEGKNIRPTYDNEALRDLYDAQWKLVTTYIMYLTNTTKNIELVTFIFNQCIKTWHETHDDIFTYRKFCWQFLEDLIEASDSNQYCVEPIPIFENIIKILKYNLPLGHIYRIIWSLEIAVLETKTSQTVKVLCCNNESIYSTELIKTIYNFGKNVGDLIKTNVDCKTYFASANDVVGDIIKKHIKYIENNIRSIELLPHAVLYAHAADGLTDVHCVETYLLALYILPSVHTAHSKTVLNKIKVFNSEEVKFHFCNKFC